MAVTPKPLKDMTDDEVRAWAEEVHAQLVAQNRER
jgi:hypothetical protein